jgi:4-aminobutyrate aminotransferase-like enzyme
MAEITDRPEYRIGQPVTFPVHYIPFHNRNDPRSATLALEALREIIRREGDRIASFVVELVQGEAGFVTAPREFFVPLFEECKRAGIVVWVDEVQTFGRTGELFATTRLDLAEYVEVITVRCSERGTIPTAPSNDPGLVSGTFSGATVAMAVGRRIIEKVVGEGFFGSRGREIVLEKLTRAHLEPRPETSGCNIADRWRRGDARVSSR